jgi:FkbM family methyltransferase
MNLAKLARIPHRFKREIKTMLTLKNWINAISSELTNASLNNLQLRNGIKLRSPNAVNLSFLFHEIWIDECYNPSGYKIRSNDTVIDIGANIGIFAIYAATRAPGVKVYAYEPFPGCVEWLRKNLTDSGITNVLVYQQAVAGNIGTRRLKADPENWVMHSLTNENSVDKGIEVNCTTLDEILYVNKIETCDLLKIDCEGGEYEILQNSSPSTLNRVKRIVAEYHEGSSFTGNGEDLCKFLESRSFRIDRFEMVEPNAGYINAINTTT